MHFTVDEKFIPFAQRVYQDAFPDSNEYRVLGYASMGFKFIQSASNVKIADAGYWTSKRLTEELAEYDCLVIHYLTREFIQAIPHVPENVMIVWSGWGGDYEPLLEPIIGRFVLPATARIPHRQSLAARAWPLLRTPGKLAGLLIDKLMRALAGHGAGSSAADILAVANRIQVISVNPAEVPLMKQAVQTQDMIYHTLHYYSTETVFEPGPPHMCGPDILVGNSASPTNNHVEAFELLKNLDMSNRKIIVPLSYGSPLYAQHISALGKSLFGDAFIPLVNFMPLDQYNSIIANCGTVVMNHVRQQAVGNICSAIYKGATVLLRPENPVSTFCADLGVTIRTLPPDHQLNENDLRPLSVTQQASNRSIMGAYWSYSRVVAEAKKLAQYQQQYQPRQAAQVTLNC